MTDEHTHAKHMLCRRTSSCTHTSLQVIVHYGLPALYPWKGSGHFLNTNGSCVHTHVHKRIYTHKPSMLLTRTFSQQRGSGVFSFDPTHAMVVSHRVSQTTSIIHTHTQAQIYTFSHAKPSFFFPLTPTSTISLFSHSHA